MVRASAGRRGVQRRLEDELERLRQATGMGHGLGVKWFPDGGSKLSGEVREGVVYIYDESEAEALQTLRHEFLDYLVSQAIEPYKDITNRLIKHVTEDAYKKKEKVVEALARLIGKEDGMEDSR
jgi:hypothetical protein